VVREVQRHRRQDPALGQVLGYMGAITREMTAEGEHVGRRVRGILVAKDFSDRVRHASLAVPDLRLVGDAARLTLEDCSLGWGDSPRGGEADGWRGRRGEPGTRRRGDRR
jgi:hypothetical protein